MNTMTNLSTCKPTSGEMSDMVQAYLECAVWADLPEEACQTEDDLTEEAVERAERDCQRLVAVMLSAGGLPVDCDYSALGHDLWLTRNHHGAGYWDGDWPEPLATRLTMVAHNMGQCGLYVDDDGYLGLE